MSRKCEKCGTELTAIEAASYADSRDLCIRCRTYEAPLTASTGLGKRYCERCGAQLQDFHVASLIGPGLCPVCRASVLSYPSDLHFPVVQEPIGLVMRETEFQRNLLRTLTPGILVDVPRITGYSPSILKQIPDRSAYLGDVFHDVGTIQSGLLGLATANRMKISDIAGSVASANLTITDTFSSLLSDVSSVQLSLSAVGQSWLKPLSIVGPLELSHHISSAMSTIVGISLASENQFLAFDPLRLSDRPGITGALARESIASLGGMASSYKALWSELGTDPSSLLRASPVVVQEPPMELYRAGWLARVIAPIEGPPIAEEVEKIPRVATPTSSVRERIRSLGEPLVTMYDGAIEALARDAADKPRHVCISLRELITQVLRSLAPDGAVSKWSTDPKHLREGQPTRRARLLYICRNIDVGSFSGFVRSDVESTLKFIGLLQEGTHSLSSPFGEGQLRTLVSRAESLLSFLIDTSQS